LYQKNIIKKQKYHIAQTFHKLAWSRPLSGTGLLNSIFCSGFENTLAQPNLVYRGVPAPGRRLAKIFVHDKIAALFDFKDNLMFGRIISHSIAKGCRGLS